MGLLFSLVFAIILASRSACTEQPARNLFAFGRSAAVLLGKYCVIKKLHQTTVNACILWVLPAIGHQRSEHGEATAFIYSGVFGDILNILLLMEEVGVLPIAEYFKQRYK